MNFPPQLSNVMSRGLSEMTVDDRDWPGIAGDGQGRHGLLQGHPRRLVGVRDYKRKARKRFAIFSLEIFLGSLQEIHVNNRTL